MAKAVDYDVVFASTNKVKGQFAEDLTASLKTNPEDGWISKKNCRFPQVMIFKLKQLADVTRFEFTTLKGYIPNKLEFLGATCGSKNRDFQKLNYQPLVTYEMPPGPRKDGVPHLIFSAGVCDHIKIRFHAPKEDAKNNPYNQVACADILFYGIPTRESVKAFLHHVDSSEDEEEPVKHSAKASSGGGAGGIFYNSGGGSSGPKGSSSKEDEFRPTLKNDRLTSAYRNAERNRSPGQSRNRSPLRNKRLTSAPPRSSHG